MTPYDAVLIVSFGGPEAPAEVMPFLEHVVAGRGVPPSRLTAVARQYDQFGGVSPINAQNRALVAALRLELNSAGIDLPVYWGNRHSAPWLADAVKGMAADGVQRALAWVTSAYPSWSGCRQYLDAIETARAQVGPGAPAIDKLRLFSDHPGLIEPWAEALTVALSHAGTDPLVLFTAHSIPADVAATCDYQARLAETAQLVAARAGEPRWEMVFQSRSGPPTQDWLGPDVGDRICALPPGTGTVVVAPIGFVSDHMEVLYDLDTRAAAMAADRGITFVRVPTPGTHPRFVAMIRQLIEERTEPSRPRLSLGARGPAPDRCEGGCCPPGNRPSAGGGTPGGP